MLLVLANPNPADTIKSPFLTGPITLQGTRPVNATAVTLGPVNEPFINVAYNGEAWVNEGNHRIMAAAALGWDTLPVELRYFDGGERIEHGAMYPAKIGLA